MLEQEPEKEPKEESSKFMSCFNRLKGEHRWTQLIDYAKQNTREVLSYALLTLGLCLLFINSFLGQMIIGIIAACYFSDELTSGLFQGRDLVKRLGITRAMIVGVALFAFFVEAPYIFIGCGMTIGLKYLLFPEKGS